MPNNLINTNKGLYHNLIENHNDYPSPNLINNSLIEQIFNELVGASIKDSYQLIGQESLNYWTIEYFNENNQTKTKYFEYLTIDISGKIIDAIVIVEDIDYNLTYPRVIETHTKTYNTLNYNTNGDFVIKSKYEIKYIAENITELPLEQKYSYKTDPNTTVTLDNTTQINMDASGNEIYSFKYKYQYTKYKKDDDWTAVEYVEIYTDSTITYISSWDPFKNFIFDEDGSLFNTDIFTKYNSNSNYPIIETIGDDLKKHYFTITYNNNGIAQIGQNFKLSDIKYFNVKNDSIIDISGNIISSDLSGNITTDIYEYNGPFLIISYDDDGTSKIKYYYDINKSPRDVILFKYTFGKFEIDSDGIVSLTGLVFLQLNNTLIVVDEDNKIDAYCDQINQMIDNITDYGTANFKFGTLDDYAPLINAVNDYTNTLENTKLELDLANVEYLENYAANIQSMTHLFGELVLKLNSVELVNSDAICLRIKTALISIYDGIQGIKAFKIAIGQQNLLKISESIMVMGSNLKKLYGDIDGTIVGTKKFILNNSNIGPLFNLQESLWFFALNLPTDTYDYNGKTYYKTHSSPKTNISSSNPSIWVTKEFYNNFNMNENDSNDIKAAIELIKNMKNNINENVDIINKNPNLIDINDTLIKFDIYNDNLKNAKAAIIDKLGALGLKINLKKP